MNHRVKSYRVNGMTNDEKNTPYELKLEFTEAQAASVGTVLETDGINIIMAQKLIQKWRDESARSNSNRQYSIPFVKK